MFFPVYMMLLYCTEVMVVAVRMMLRAHVVRFRRLKHNTKIGKECEVSDDFFLRSYIVIAPDCTIQWQCW